MLASFRGVRKLPGFGGVFDQDDEFALGYGCEVSTRWPSSVSMQEGSIVPSETP